MKNKRQKGFVIPFMIITISLLIFCIGFYIYLISKQKIETPVIFEPVSNFVEENPNTSVETPGSNFSSTTIATTTPVIISTTTDEIDDTDYEESIVCTMEAKICEDGSSVGRTGPNCEFVCPE